MILIIVKLSSIVLLRWLAYLRDALWTATYRCKKLLEVHGVYLVAVIADHH